MTLVTFWSQVTQPLFFPALQFAQDVAIDADGQVLVADNGAGAVLVFESSGKLIRTIGAGKGTKQGQFKDISAVAVDPATGDVIVADSRIQARLNPAGYLLRPKQSEGLPFLASVISGGIGAMRVLQQKVVKAFGIFG